MLRIVSDLFIAAGGLGHTLTGVDRPTRGAKAGRNLEFASSLLAVLSPTASAIVKSWTDL